MLCPSSCYYKMPNTNLAGGGDPNVGPADGAVVLLLAPLSFSEGCEETVKCNLTLAIALFLLS